MIFSGYSFTLAELQVWHSFVLLLVESRMNYYVISKARTALMVRIKDIQQFFVLILNVVFSWYLSLDSGELLSHLLILSVYLLKGLTTRTNVETSRSSMPAYLSLLLLHDAQKPIEHLIVFLFDFFVLAPLQSGMVAC